MSTSDRPSVRATAVVVGLGFAFAGCLPNIVWDAPNDTPACYANFTAAGECECLRHPGCVWCTDDSGYCEQVNRKGCKASRDTNEALCGPLEPDLDAGTVATDAGPGLDACTAQGTYRCSAGTDAAEACESKDGALGWGAVGGAVAACIGATCEEPASDTSYFLCSDDRTRHQVLEGRYCEVETATACRSVDVMQCVAHVWKVYRHCDVNRGCAPVPDSPAEAPEFACAGLGYAAEGDPCGASARVPTCSSDLKSILTCERGNYEVLTDCEALDLECVLPASPGEPTCGP